MTDTNYLYEYFLKNSPGAEEEAAARQEDADQEDEDQ